MGLARLAALILPALIPSWRFFDRIGPAPTARYAAQNTAGTPLLWQPLAPRRASRGPLALIASLLHNPARNEALYIQSLAERLITEDRPHAAGELRAFAARAASREGGGARAFFVSVTVLEPGADAPEEVYRSGPHPLP